LRGPREKRAPQVARSEAKGRVQWGRLFFGYFLLAKCTDWVHGKQVFGDIGNTLLNWKR